MPSRRRFLRTVTPTAGLLCAGCIGKDPQSSSTEYEETPTERPGEHEETTTERPDEREETEPPGDPPVDSAGRWPEYRFDSGNTGYNSEGEGLRDGMQYWRLRPSSTASLVDGTLYNLAGYDEEGGALTRRNSSTAAVESATPLVQYGVSGPPTVRDEHVFVNTFIEVFCLAASEDERLWQGPEMDGIQGNPAVSDGAVFVNSGGFKSVSPQLRAFSVDDGQQLWRYDVDSETKSTPAVADGRVFVVASDGIHGVDAATGERLFHVPEAGNRWTSPAVADGTIYSTVRGENEETVVAVDAADGTVRWRSAVTEMGGSPPVVANDEVYVRIDGEVVALDPDDGSRLRTIGLRSVPVARVGEVLYGVDDGIIKAYDVDGEGQLWSHRTESVQVADTVGRSISGVTPVDGAVYVSARDGFHAFGPGDS